MADWGGRRLPTERAGAEEGYVDALAQILAPAPIQALNPAHDIQDGFSDDPALYKDPKGFAAAVTRAIDNYGLGVDAFCSQFEVKASTVSRWKNRRNSPHPDARRRILVWVEEQVACTPGADSQVPTKAQEQAEVAAETGGFRGRKFAHFLRWPNNEDALTDKDRDVAFSFYDDSVVLHLPEDATRFWVGRFNFELEATSGIRCFVVIGLSPVEGRTLLAMNNLDPRGHSFGWSNQVLQTGAG